MPCRTTSSRRWPTASSTSGSWPQTQVVNPPTPRTPSSRESILRGREPVPGPNDRKARMRRLPRPAGHGRRPSFVSQDVFNEVVFGGNPSEHAADAIEPAPTTKTQDALGSQKPDDWGNPLRPANLNRGVYKGGGGRSTSSGGSPRGSTAPRCRRTIPSPLNEQEGLGPGQLRAGTALRARAARRRAASPPRPGGRLDARPASERLDRAADRLVSATDCSTIGPGSRSRFTEPNLNCLIQTT